MVYVYTHTHNVTHPLKKKMPFVARLVDLEIIILSKSKTEKDK